MECRVSGTDKGWDSAVVSRYGATKLSFTKEGEGSGAQTKYGRQANEGVCETLFHLCNDFEFYAFLCCAKRRLYGLQG
jgi:hypothetical protein